MTRIRAVKDQGLAGESRDVGHGSDERSAADIDACRSAGHAGRVSGRAGVEAAVLHFG